MTDAPMDAGSAPASAEPTGAVIPTDAPSHTQPLGSQTPVEPTPDASVETKPAATAYEAIQKANAKLKAEPKTEPKTPAPDVKAAKAEAPKAEPKPDTPVKDSQPRGEGGRFAGKEPVADQAKTEQAAPADSPAPAKDVQNTQHREPPARFTSDAKAAWEAAPEPVKAEVHRAIRELEQGHQKYKADADAFNEVREYSDLARQHGTTMKAALDNYVGIERLLAKDPQAGFEQIIRNFGWKTPDGRAMTLRDFAAQILGQTPDEQAGRQDSIISELRSEISGLKQQLGGVAQHIQRQTQDATLHQVTEFASNHPRFEELSEAIQEEIRHGYDLETAYSRAERLNPAPVKPAASEPPVIPAKTATPLNPAGSKSISGAPSSGSNPAVTTNSNQPVPSITEALQKALRRSAA